MLLVRLTVIVLTETVADLESVASSVSFGWVGRVRLRVAVRENESMLTDSCCERVKDSVSSSVKVLNETDSCCECVRLIVIDVVPVSDAVSGLKEMDAECDTRWESVTLWLAVLDCSSVPVTVGVSAVLLHVRRALGLLDPVRWDENVIPVLESVKDSVPVRVREAAEDVGVRLADSDADLVYVRWDVTVGVPVARCGDSVRVVDAECRLVGEAVLDGERERVSVATPPTVVTPTTRIRKRCTVMQV